MPPTKHNRPDPPQKNEVSHGHFAFKVVSKQAGLRLDLCLAQHMKPLSRSYAGVLVSQGMVLVDGHPRKPGYKLKEGQVITGDIPEPEPIDCVAQDIPLDIIHEDGDLIVINKNAGMVVHPAPGHTSGTLVNALLYHCPDIKSIGGWLRPGIVHRLDKDTSGILVVAKNAKSHNALSDDFKTRNIEKQYLALVYGKPSHDHGRIDLPIGRHPLDRKRMSTKTNAGRSALTLWKIKERYQGGSLMALDLKTGRTHQIRTHLKAIGHPVLGDPVYFIKGLKKHLAAQNRKGWQAVKNINRQMLHARRISFCHPKTRERVSFKADLPEDMKALIAVFKDAK